jgi:ATPase subunit of ABC transporter with duplicated ATPase domains
MSSVKFALGTETEPSSGVSSPTKKLTIGYFRQDVEEMQGRSVLDEAIAGSGQVLRDFREALRMRTTDSSRKARV